MDEKTTTWERKGRTPAPMAVSSPHSIHPPIQSSTHPTKRESRAARKPSSVGPPRRARGHPSGAGVSTGLELPTRESRRGGPPQAPIFGIAPSGVCRADASPRRWWALTPPFHLCRYPPRRALGRVFSVALSRALRLVGVTHRSALWSSDFPRAVTSTARGHVHGSALSPNDSPPRPRSQCRHESGGRPGRGPPSCQRPHAQQAVTVGVVTRGPRSPPPFPRRSGGRLPPTCLRRLGDSPTRPAGRRAGAEPAASRPQLPDRAAAQRRRGVQPAARGTLRRGHALRRTLAAGDSGGRGSSTLRRAIVHRHQQ